MTGSLDVAPKTTEHNLIVRIGKSKAEVTIIKDCTRGFVLLKLTTDGHETSRGLPATAELLVLHCHNARSATVDSLIGQRLLNWRATLQTAGSIYSRYADKHSACDSVMLHRAHL